jgi:hypothetical protein
LPLRRISSSSLLSTVADKAHQGDSDRSKSGFKRSEQFCTLPQITPDGRVPHFSRSLREVGLPHRDNIRSPAAMI